MVEYLEHLIPFGSNQGLQGDELIQIVQFSIPHKLKYQLLVQGYEATGKDLNGIVEFYETLDTSKYIYNNQGEITHDNKKTNQSGVGHQKYKSASTGSDQAKKHPEE